MIGLLRCNRVTGTLSLSLLAAAAMAASSTMPEPTQADVAWVVEGEFCEPETVLPLPDGTLLVSNVCGFEEDGSGFLSLLNADGSVIEWRFLDGLDAPLGMAIHGRFLYVVDNNRLRFFALPSFTQTGTQDLESAVANDVAVTSTGRIFVTDTARGQVIEVRHAASQRVFLGASRFPGANGIEAHGDDLYIGGKRLWKVHLPTSAVTTIGPDWLTDIDGIEIEADGTLQITPVAGPLVRFRDDDNIEILGGDGISSANHGYAPELGLALIPTGYDNTVIAIRVPSWSDPAAP